jgi:hypothetical protein
MLLFSKQGLKDTYERSCEIRSLKNWARQLCPFWHKLTLEHPSLSNPPHHTHKILMLQENVGVVWPFMKGEDTL